MAAITVADRPTRWVRVAPSHALAAARPGVAVSLRSRHLRAVPDARAAGSEGDDQLMARIARGDQAAFAQLYDRLGGNVYGLVKRTLRDPAQSEEVTQEVMLEVWRTAPKYDATRGSLKTWVMTLAHRRAVDRVRSEQSSRDRDRLVGEREWRPPFDVVADEVEVRAEHEQVRVALDALTDLQREAIELAYYGGLTYREVAQLLDAPLATVKTRMRDGLVRLRDELGVTT